MEPNPQAGLERLIDALRATDDPLKVRLASEIEAVLDGSKKRGMGDAGYQHLRYHLPRLRDLALEMGALPPGATARAPNRRRGKRRYTFLAPPTWFRRNWRRDSVEHRYGGADLEVYGEMALAALPFEDAVGIPKRFDRFFQKVDFVAGRYGGPRMKGSRPWNWQSSCALASGACR